MFLDDAKSSLRFLFQYCLDRLVGPLFYGLNKEINNTGNTSLYKRDIHILISE